ncbi:unnamed protein product [Trichogramma brassicae]|uniref:Uncharacterized protein n=1 Tax=Trichogramma brassicae TaxID=86971 RepID=A0A6H5IRY3_9HYME|nr:unnamed protein product [Trichogramma brassicae]
MRALCMNDVYYTKEVNRVTKQISFDSNFNTERRFARAVHAYRFGQWLIAANITREKCVPHSVNLNRIIPLASSHPLQSEASRSIRTSMDIITHIYPRVRRARTTIASCMYFAVEVKAIARIIHDASTRTLRIGTRGPILVACAMNYILRVVNRSARARRSLVHISLLAQCVNDTLLYSFRS